MWYGTRLFPLVPLRPYSRRYLSLFSPTAVLFDWIEFDVWNQAVLQWSQHSTAVARRLKQAHLTRSIPHRALLLVTKIHRCNDRRLSSGFLCNFSAKAHIGYVTKTRRHDIIMIWYYYRIIFHCRFASRFQNIYFGKYTAFIHRPRNMVTVLRVVKTSFSRFQTLSPHPLD